MVEINDVDIRNSHKKKRKHVDEEDTEWICSQQPTGAVKKIWSDEDEIKLLEVLKRRSDKSDMTRLYEIAKPLLKGEYLKSQVTKKVRGFRTTFMKNTQDKALPLSTHHAKIGKLCEEIWGGISGPVMTIDEFEARYTRVNACIDVLPPYNKMTDDGKDVIRECMTLLSLKELDEMEDEWFTYYEEEVEASAKQVMLRNKLLKLLRKGRRAYNLAH